MAQAREMTEQVLNRDINSPYQCYKLLLGYLPVEVKSKVTAFFGIVRWWPQHGSQFKAERDFLIRRYGGANHFPHAVADIHLRFAALA